MLVHRIPNIQIKTVKHKSKLFTVFFKLIMLVNYITGDQIALVHLTVVACTNWHERCFSALAVVVQQLHMENGGFIILLGFVTVLVR